MVRLWIEISRKQKEKRGERKKKNRKKEGKRKKKRRRKNEKRKEAKIPHRYISEAFDKPNMNSTLSMAMCICICVFVYYFIVYLFVCIFFIFFSMCILFCLLLCKIKHPSSFEGFCESEDSGVFSSQSIGINTSVNDIARFTRFIFKVGLIQLPHFYSFLVGRNLNVTKVHCNIGT